MVPIDHDLLLAGSPFVIAIACYMVYSMHRGECDPIIRGLAYVCGVLAVAFAIGGVIWHGLGLPGL